jgi:integrase/recombinase XerD
MAGAAVTALAPVLQAFFADRLARQLHASGQTIAAYRDTWRLPWPSPQSTPGGSPQSSTSPTWTRRSSAAS